MAQKVPRGAPESIGSIGDITALASVSTPSLSLLCVGVAAQILVFDAGTGRQLAKTCWEGGERIHGIAVEKSSSDGRIDDGSSTSSTSATSSSSFLLVAHGDRGAASYLLSVGRDRASLTETWRRSFGAWTLDAVPFTPSASRGSRREKRGGGTVVAVGEADGSVSLHRASSCPPSPSSSDSDSDSLLLGSRCAERCLLYSMALLPMEEEETEEEGGEGEGEEGGNASWWVAGGSVFLDVLVWRLIPPSRGKSGSGALLSCPVLFKLSGHEGSIHRVAWAAPPLLGVSPAGSKAAKEPPPPPGSLLLASASDDRTLRLWSVPRCCRSCSSSSSPAVVVPGPVFRGHGARLWDIAFVSANPPPSAGGGDGDENGGENDEDSAFSRSFLSSSSSSSSSYPPRFVLSTSEDCSARLWSVLGEGKGGKGSSSSVATLRGHRGRGIWRAAAVAPPSTSSPSSPSSSSSSFLLPLIATAGADGAVQLWRLSDHVSSRKEGEEGRLIGFPPPLPISRPPPGGSNGGERERAVEISSFPSSASAAARTLYAAGPGVLLVGTGDGAVWRVDLGVSPEGGSPGAAARKGPERGGGGGGGGGAGGKRRTGGGAGGGGRDSWSLVFRAPRGGSVLSLAAVPCRRHGLLLAGGEGEGRSSGSSGNTWRRPSLSCAAAAAPSSSSSSSSPADKITRATPLLVLAALGRGEAALGCDCARFLKGGEPSSRPPPGREVDEGGDGAEEEVAELAPEQRWRAAPGREEGGAPLFRCFLPRELGGDVALTTSTLGDLSVWKLRRGGGGKGRPPPPLLAAAAPPRRARKQRDLAVSCVSACGPRGMLFAGDSAGGVLAYSLPGALFDDEGGEEEEDGEGGGEEERRTPSVLVVVAKTKTPDESAVTCLRLLPLPRPPPSSSPAKEGEQPHHYGCCCCGELRVGDCAGRATTLRLTPNSTSAPLPFSLPAVGGGRLPFPLVALDIDHPDPAVSSGERVVGGFNGDTWIAVSYPRAGGGNGGERADEEEEEEEEGSCFEVARATTGGWRRPAALVPGCDGAASFPAVPAALVHCAPSRRGGMGNREGGELVAREWGSRGRSEMRSGEEEQEEPPPLARVGLPAGHGLEVHASIALPSPSSTAAGKESAAAVLTASEDGSLRWLLVRSYGGKVSPPPLPSLEASGLVRALSDGSALRACAFVRTPGSSRDSSSSSSGDFLVFASGVRAYVTAWRAWWSDSGSSSSSSSSSGGGEEGKGGKEEEEKRPLRFRTAWLAASSAGVRSGKEARRASSRCARAEAGPRALHAAAFEIEIDEEEEEKEEGKVETRKGGVVAVLVATSLGAVEAIAFDSSSGEFLQSQSQQPVRLEYHEGPALCVSHLRMPSGDSSFPMKNGLAFSGSTDGGVAVWAGAKVARALLLLSASASASSSSSSSSSSVVVTPLAVLPALHQSGVNCLAAAAIPSSPERDSSSSSERFVLLVTGGDDGALRAMLLSVSSPSSASSSSSQRRPEVSICASATLEGAHSACALRGAWVGEFLEQRGKSGESERRAEVVTVGLDQRLRGWAVSLQIESESDKKEEEKSIYSVSLAALWSVPVQVPAPESLAVLPERGLVSVSGRGTQAFSWK